MKKCPKHIWHEIEVQHLPKIDLNPGGINYAFGVFHICICLHCGKIKGKR